MSPAQEIAVGQQQYQPSQQAQGGRYYIDPDLQVYVQQVGQKLASVSDRPDLPYEFVLLNNNEANAWALPGGKIAINRGLLLHLKNEAELAAVLAHEIVHAAARHSAQQMTRGTILGAGTQVLGMVLADSGYSQIANTASQLGASAWMARYSREAELESDAYGMRYMARAGYDPYAAVTLQETFVKLSQGQTNDFLSALFASHPPSQARVDANRRLAQTLPAGQTFSERYQRKIAQLKRDKPAYEAQAEAMSALQQKNPSLALEKLDEAVRIQPEDGYFWELRGHAWKMQKQYDKAEQAFSTAIRKNPDLFSHYLARGLLRYEQGNKTAARADLERSNQLLETQVANYLLGELALQDNKPAQAYYGAAARQNGQLEQQAQNRLQALELSLHPEKYIQARAYVNAQGQLMVAVSNRTNVSVSDIAVTLTEMLTPYTAGSSTTISVPTVLRADQQVTVPTSYRGKGGTRHIHAQVTAARLAC